jgi:hypothetical protein
MMEIPSMSSSTQSGSAKGIIAYLTLAFGIACWLREKSGSGGVLSWIPLGLLCVWITLSRANMVSVEQPA